jgi:hypothetical protein
MLRGHLEIWREGGVLRGDIQLDKRKDARHEGWIFMAPIAEHVARYSDR